jgi:sec-independent protein translocase protein TatA
MGEDLGSAIKGFKKGMQDGDAQPQLKADPPPSQPQPQPGETKSERAES